MPEIIDHVELLIDGKAHGNWDRYEIDSDLMIPADAWSVSLGASGGRMPVDVVEGMPVVVKIGTDTALTGYVDEISHSVSKGAQRFTMSGRDLAADLLDCSAPIFATAQSTLQQIVASITREFKITKIRIDADSVFVRKKINTQPGDTAWDMLRNVAEANGLWAWFEPDGTLVVGGPDYSSPIVATLVMRRNGNGNNVISLDRVSSRVGRYSQVTVLGQSAGNSLDQGIPDLHASWKDNGVIGHRPKIFFDAEAENGGMCSARAHKMIDDSRLNGQTITATVKGHRIVAPGQPFDNKLWNPGQRIHVLSEPHGIDAPYFLMARKFIRNRMDGTITVLTLKEDGVWLAGAHPHKKHRGGKNSAPLQIVTA
ncbi:phage late control protein Gpd [mine drainage metagenome]|uniref:Phage late control protein Gpd n=1 Tax=mine drainage metagenome TaxID=410659 RepID=A0A1J5TXN4_9ZZZZ